KHLTGTICHKHYPLAGLRARHLSEVERLTNFIDILSSRVSPFSDFSRISDLVERLRSTIEYHSNNLSQAMLLVGEIVEGDKVTVVTR
ncbi:hypothetical protein AKJ16_DCAP20047, partial [Drosera capensis]